MSFFFHDPVDASIILIIVLISGLLGFWQERGAADAVEKLLAIVRIMILYIFMAEAVKKVFYHRMNPQQIVVMIVHFPAVMGRIKWLLTKSCATIQAKT